MTISDFIKSALNKKKKTELTSRDKAKILRKFNSLIEDEICNKNSEYYEASDRALEEIEDNFELHFPDYLSVRDEIVQYLTNNKEVL